MLFAPPKVAASAVAWTNAAAASARAFVEVPSQSPQSALSLTSVNGRGNGRALNTATDDVLAVSSVAWNVVPPSASHPHQHPQLA